MAKVRWLSLREIASMWAVEAHIPESAMLRELRYGVININRLRNGEKLFDVPPPDSELPDPDERVDRQWLMEFCAKQEDWPRPEFWFGKLDDRGERYPGRPSVKRAVLLEFGKLALNYRLETTLAKQARVLAAWAETEFPGKQTPSARSVENQIREEYNRVKAHIASESGDV
jgi:hypothetical protein